MPWLGAAVAVNVEDVFQGLEVQRLRLHHDQQVPEWKGKMVGRLSSLAFLDRQQRAKVASVSDLVIEVFARFEVVKEEIYIAWR